MTKRTLNTNELEIIAGGAVEVAQDGASPTQTKNDPLTPSGNSGGASTGSGIDTEIFGQDNDL